MGLNSFHVNGVTDAPENSLPLRARQYSGAEPLSPIKIPRSWKTLRIQNAGSPGGCEFHRQAFSAFWAAMKSSLNFSPLARAHLLSRARHTITRRERIITCEKGARSLSAKCNMLLFHYTHNGAARACIFQYKQKQVARCLMKSARSDIRTESNSSLTQSAPPAL